MKHKFVEYIPDILEEGVIYISMDYATAAHLCACGCGNEVVTPFSPMDWRMTFNGEAVSLRPSIGNWNFDCRSHYWIKNNRVEWAESWSEKEISDGRISDKHRKEIYYQAEAITGDVSSSSDEITTEDTPIRIKSGFWERIKNWIFFWNKSN